MHYGYRGLKIFTSLALRFQDFQRWKGKLFVGILGQAPSGIKVSDEDLGKVNLIPAKFHGKDWNYAIKSRR